jgi:pantoate--beta-alanine ligase
LKDTKKWAKNWLCSYYGCTTSWAHFFIRNCKKENDEIISSIFVNPTQFNNPDDFEKYPQTLENDLKLLEKAGVDAVYVPKAIDIYPEGLKANIMILMDWIMKWKANTDQGISMV